MSSECVLDLIFYACSMKLDYDLTVVQLQLESGPRLECIAETVSNMKIRHLDDI